MDTRASDMATIDKLRQERVYIKVLTGQFDFKCSSKSILHCLQMLSVEPIQAEDENSGEVFDGQTEFYEFIDKLYRSMLDDPEEFFVPTNTMHIS